MTNSPEGTNHTPAIQMNQRQQQTAGRQSFAQANNDKPKHPNRESNRGYDPMKKCDYHSDEMGHSTDECFTLKHKIQNLLDTKAFSFQTVRPNVQKNPLPEHEGTVNAILEHDIGRIKSLKVHVMDILRQPNDRWGGMDGLTPPETENLNDVLEGVRNLFDDPIIGAIDDRPPEKMGLGPQE